VSEMDSVVGSRIRAARQAHGMTLRALAEKVGVSASMLSLLENGKSRSSVPTLYAVVEALDMSMDELFLEEGTAPASAPPAPEGGDLLVVRAGHRRRIEMENGVMWEQLGHNAEDGLDFMMVTYPPGARSSDSGRYQRHNGLEAAYIVQGELTCKVTFDEVTLAVGDSITFDSSRPHLLENKGIEAAKAVWVIIRHHANHLPESAAQHLAHVPDPAALLSSYRMPFPS
jgi:transcriptional regulator with XRE-family HTH domain